MEMTDLQVIKEALSFSKISESCLDKMYIRQLTKHINLKLLQLNINNVENFAKKFKHLCLEIETGIVLLDLILKKAISQPLYSKLYVKLIAKLKELNKPIGKAKNIANQKKIFKELFKVRLIKNVRKILFKDFTKSNKKMQKSCKTIYGNEEFYLNKCLKKKEKIATNFILFSELYSLNIIHLGNVQLMLFKLIMNFAYNCTNYNKYDPFPVHYQIIEGIIYFVANQRNKFKPKKNTQKKKNLLSSEQCSIEEINTFIKYILEIVKSNKKYNKNQLNQILPGSKSCRIDSYWMISFFLKGLLECDSISSKIKELIYIYIEFPKIENEKKVKTQNFKSKRNKNGFYFDTATPRLKYKKGNKNDTFRNTIELKYKDGNFQYCGIYLMSEVYNNNPDNIECASNEKIYYNTLENNNKEQFKQQESQSDSEKSNFEEKFKRDIKEEIRFYYEQRKEYEKKSIYKEIFLYNSNYKKLGSFAILKIYLELFFDCKGIFGDTRIDLANNIIQNFETKTGLYGETTLEIYINFIWKNISQLAKFFGLVVLTTREALGFKPNEIALLTQENDNRFTSNEKHIFYKKIFEEVEGYIINEAYTDRKLEGDLKILKKTIFNRI